MLSYRINQAIFRPNARSCNARCLCDARMFAVVAQLVEHFHGKEEVTGSIPVYGSMGRY